MVDTEERKGEALAALALCVHCAERHEAILPLDWLWLEVVSRDLNAVIAPLEAGSPLRAELEEISQALAGCMNAVRTGRGLDFGQLRRVVGLCNRMELAAT